MIGQHTTRFSALAAGLVLALMIGVASVIGWTSPAQAATKNLIIGAIDFLTVTNPADHWSGGSVVVGGQTVTIPQNLLIDLPANRLTLQEIFAQAPAACVASGQSGLAKADTCNANTGAGYITIAANRTSIGNIIAGDIFLEKGTDAVDGTVTYINYNEGYFRMNGNPGDATTGVMVRLNDPVGRHTLQLGAGCTANAPNCSPDPRFTADIDNYTLTYVTGYPVCIPSTVSRSFTNSINLGLLGTGTVTSRATATGTGDLLCPETNRTINLGNPVNDSRVFAPLQVGDSLTAEGNFEKIGGIRFLSAHTMQIDVALTTKDLPDQPDYFTFDEIFIDAPAFQNERIRMLIIGFTTRADFNALTGGSSADVLFWSSHYDPQNNSSHEFPLASIAGCDAAAGAGTCSSQGLIGIVGPALNIAGANIFRIRYDVDFRVGANSKLNPCLQLLAEPRFNTPGICPNGGGVLRTPPPTDLYGMLSPIPHEIVARSGHKVSHPGLIALDLHGVSAKNGEYVFPLGIGLGGIDIQNFLEIDIAKVQTPYPFSAIPWLMDRRLSPQGCSPANQCENTRQPLTPFPFEGLDPRTQSVLISHGTYNDPVFTAAPLRDATNRMLTFVQSTPGNPLTDGKANGNNTVLPWPPTNPAFIPITVTPDPPAPTNHPPTITSVAPLTATVGVAYTYTVVATDPDGDIVTYSLQTAPAGMTINATTGAITWTPTVPQAPAQGVVVRATDPGGLFGVQAFVVTVNAPPVFVTTPPLTASANVLYSYQAFATDVNGGALTYSLVAPFPVGMTVNTTTGLVTWTPTAAQGGANAVNLRVTDSTALSATQTFTVTVAGNVAPVITSAPVTSGTVGVAYSYQVVATDANGDPITYSLAAGAPAGMAISVTGLITWTPAASGSFPVTVRATDPGGLAATQSFTIAVIVAGANVAPVITSTAITTATAGVLYNYQVVATDANGDTLTYSLTVAPAGMTISPTTGLISWTPAASGSFSVTVRVADPGGLAATQSFTVNVTTTTPVAPVIDSVPTLTGKVGVPYVYTLHATDANVGDTITYLQRGGNPGNFTINSTTGVVSWTPNQAGTISIRLRAQDQTGLFADQTFSVVVAP